MSNYKPDWIKERDERYWREYREHVLSLSDYYCPYCGVTRLHKEPGQCAKWCDKCIKFRGNG